MCGVVPTADDRVLRPHSAALRLVACQEGRAIMFLLPKKNEATRGNESAHVLHRGKLILNTGIH